jgi:hypothetical protein
MRLIATLLFILVTMAPARADVKNFRDWLASCDNGRSCVALALREQANGVYLRLDREGTPNAKPRLTILVRPENAKTVTLAFNDASLAGLPKGNVALKIEDDEFARIAIPDADTEALLAAIRKAEKIVVGNPEATKDDEKIVGEISLSGAAAALLWIDEQQKRLDTVTALVRRGAKPASAVPAPPAVPLVTAAKAGGPAVKTVPQAVSKKAFVACDEGENNDENKPVESEPSRLGSTQLLYSFQCRSKSGAYNAWNTLLIAPRSKPAAAQTVRLPNPPGEKASEEMPEDFIINGHFDEDTQTLSMFSKGRGIGDCGSYAEWVFDGKGFRLTRFQTMPSCGGLISTEWPVLYRADVRR